MAQFITPDFLRNSSTDEIHKRALAVLPVDLDVSEGSHSWNMTRSAALIGSEIRGYILPEAIKLIFPEWSYGQFLDEHGKSRNMPRRAASAASGKLTITGEAGTVIPAGSLFSTAAVNDEPSVDYRVLSPTKIPASGSVSVDIECTQTGIIGNTQANTIVLVSSGIKGISGVTNPADVTGGTEVESDESYIQRMVEYDQSQGESFVGSAEDYKRWALSVPGVGTAKVIPAQDDTGLVTIIITDANGAPATEQLCKAVYDYIMKPDDPITRRAPINALLEVSPPDTMAISIRATVELLDGYTIETVQAAYKEKLALYLPEVLEDKEVKYTRLWAVLSATEGVNDFTGLEFGIKVEGEITYGTTNIKIESYELPTIASEDLILTSGEV